MDEDQLLEKIKENSQKHKLFKVSEEELEFVISLLETEDIKLRYYLGDLISYQGKKSAAELLKTLHSPSLEIRRSVVFLLGRILLKFPSPEASKELLSCLSDEDPKTRKNAAIVIGRLGDKESEEKLIEALLKEEVGWVKSSLLLAIGAVGGEEAKKLLASYQAKEDPEREALRKAKDRIFEVKEKRWRFKEVLPEPLNIELWTFRGMEEVLAEEVKDKFGLPTKKISDGILTLRYEKLPELFSLRTFSELLIPLSSFSFKNLEDCLSRLEVFFGNKSFLENIINCHEEEREPLRYRIETKGEGINHYLRRQIVEKVIKSINSPLLLNSPSNYDIELRLVIEKGDLEILWKPFTIADNRFSYRVKDVPASINPVVAAGIIRLLKEKFSFLGTNRVLDPFCGSGTILIERALGERYQELVGIDISKEAIEAAEENVRRSQLDRIVIIHKDMRDISKSESFDEIITNLPFGIRVGSHTSNEKLYRDFFSLIPTILKPKGLLVLFSQEIKLINKLLAEFSHDIRLIETRRIQTGGLEPALFIAVRK